MAVGAGTTDMDMDMEATTNMPYERDPDYMTRGVGAIAAADHVSPARHRRRVKVGRALRRRDRAMAAIAQGALGMTVSGDTGATPGGSTTKRTFRVPTGRLVPIRVAMPGIVTQSPPIVAKPPVYTPVIQAVPTPTTTPTATTAPTVTMVPIVKTASSGSVPTPGTSPPLIATSPTPSLTEVPEGSADHSTRNVVLIAAGAGVLAYLLFFRRTR